MFLDIEYSSEVFRTLLAVPHFSNVYLVSVVKKVLLKISKISCEFYGIFKNISFHRTPPVAVSEKLKAEAVVQRCSIKKLFLEIHRKILVPEPLFYSLRNATLLK